MAHSHVSNNYGRAFALGVALNLAYVLIEAGCGLWADSLALLSDAGHNLSDVIGLLLAWGGYALAQVRPSERRTYGWRGSTILAALFNAMILLAAMGGVAWEAVRRFFAPIETAGAVVVAVAAVGVVVNTLTALLFLRGRKRDLNIRGAFLHMAADAGVSAGVVAAGLAIQITGWTWVDPAASLLVAIVVFIGTWSLLRESVNLAMHAVPTAIDPADVRAYLAALDGAVGVHDLHIWAMSTSETALTVHLVKPCVEDEDALLRRVARDLHDRFGIEHVTIQIERSPNPAHCTQAPADVV